MNISAFQHCDFISKHIIWWCCYWNCSTRNSMLLYMFLLSNRFSINARHEMHPVTVINFSRLTIYEWHNKLHIAYSREKHC